MSDQRIYETVYVLHPEMSDEDVEDVVEAVRRVIG